MPDSTSSALYGRHAWRTFVAGFGFDRTHRCSQRGRGSGLEGLAPPCGQLTRCFSAVAELLVCSHTDNSNNNKYVFLIIINICISVLMTFCFQLLYECMSCRWQTRKKIFLFYLHIVKWVCDNVVAKFCTVLLLLSWSGTISITVAPKWLKLSLPKFAHAWQWCPAVSWNNSLCKTRKEFTCWPG